MFGQRFITRLGIVAATLLAFAGTTLAVPALASAAPAHDGNGSEVAPLKHQKKGKNKGKHGNKKHGHKKGHHGKGGGKK
jgi:hypothetical protein